MAGCIRFLDALLVIDHSMFFSPDMKKSVTPRDSATEHFFGKKWENTICFLAGVRKNFSHLWIPVFAGMTSWGVSGAGGFNLS
jgi:hypothetical protein